MKYKGYVVIGVRIPVEAEGETPQEAVAAAYQQFPSLIEAKDPVPVSINLDAGDGTTCTREEDISVYLRDGENREYTDDQISILRTKLEAEQEARRRAEQLLMTIIHASPGHCVRLTEKSFTDLPDHPRLHQTNNRDESFTLRVIDVPPIDPSNLVQ